MTLDDIETALVEHFDPEHLAVYSDCLQALGDPRGELIVIELHDLQDLAARRDALIAEWLGEPVAAIIIPAPGYPPSRDGVRLELALPPLVLWLEEQFAELPSQVRSAWLDVFDKYNTELYVAPSTLRVAISVLPLDDPDFAVWATLAGALRDRADTTHIIVESNDR